MGHDKLDAEELREFWNMPNNEQKKIAKLLNNRINWRLLINYLLYLRQEF
jgi:hypothetical protein